MPSETDAFWSAFLDDPANVHPIAGGGIGYGPRPEDLVGYGGQVGPTQVYIDPTRLGSQEQEVLTDPFSFAPTTGNNGASWINAIAGIANTVIGALGAPTALQGTAIQIPGGGTVDIAAATRQTPVIQAAGLGCSVKRRRYKVQRNPDGTITAVAYCLPRRMNPLNPRALARAGRRVASFSRIARGMEKMLQKACRAGARGRSRHSYSPRPYRPYCP